MKRMIPCLLAFLILAGLLTGCGAATTAAQEDAEKQTDEAAPAGAAVPEESGEEVPAQARNGAAFSPEGSVIFDRDGVKVTTAGLGTDPTSPEEDPILWVDIENNGEDVCLGVSGGSVNGTMADVLLIDFYEEEDGTYFGGDYTFSLMLPAGVNGRFALGYYRQDIPGVSMDVLGEMELCFTLAEDEFTWPAYTSEPVTIRTGETVETADIAALGTVVMEDDTMTLVIGEQDYDDWSGPEFYVYAENKSDEYIGLAAENAEADGNECGYIYYYAAIAPGKRSAAVMSFDDPIRAMRGVESLTVTFALDRADTLDGLDPEEKTVLEPVTVTYAPRVWGEYENGGMTLDIQPRYNDLITVETPENDPEGVLFSVAETASLEAGGYEGAGWLFSLARVGEERLHELLCYDMSGMEVFAKDGDGNYYLYCHPTDVRFERADPGEMESGFQQWAMLCEWAEGEKEAFISQNEGLEYFYRGNSLLDMYLARTAYDPETRYTVTGAEYGTVEGTGFDAAPYAEALLSAGFFEEETGEAPAGECLTLAFPEEDIRFDFFPEDGSVVRCVSGNYESWYGTWLYDDNITFADIMQGWYYALAENAGVRAPDTALDAFLGTWAEKIAGRGVVTITGTLAPGKARIEASWPESAAVEDAWEMTAVLTEDGRLTYENGSRTVMEYDENGEGWVTDESRSESGAFYLNGEGELCWQDDTSQNGEDSVFIPAY